MKIIKDYLGHEIHKGDIILYSEKGSRGYRGSFTEGVVVDVAGTIHVLDNYSDVTTIEIAMSYHTDKRILCPVCGKDTQAELSIEADYKDTLFSFKQTTPLSAAMNCCTPLWNSPNE